MKSYDCLKDLKEKIEEEFFSKEAQSLELETG